MKQLDIVAVIIMVGLFITASVFQVKLDECLRRIEPPATCTVERVTFPASAKECARIHKAIERRIANEAT